MSTDRSGSRLPSTVKLVALAALAVLLMGVPFVSARNNPAGTVPDAPESSPRAAIEPVMRAAPSPTSTPEAGNVGGLTRVRATFSDGGKPEELLTRAEPAAVMTELAKVSIAAGARLVTEGTPATFTLTRTGATTAALTVAVGVAESGSMLDGAAPSTVTFGVGERATTLSVVTDDDQAVDTTSRVTTTITAGSGYTVATHAGSAKVYVTDNDRDFLLPDLVADPPVQWGEAQRVTWDGEEMLVLRFEGYVTNLGDGPLDLSGDPRLADPEDPTSHDVWQRVRTSTGDWVSLTKPPVRYQTDDGHNHFHLMEIVAYSLWDEAGTSQILPGAKVGFCMLDVESLPERHSHPGDQAYEAAVVENCRANEPDADNLRMGVTEGWRDVYEGSVTFQWIDVSDLRPGNYRLASESDPYDIVVETDETNNGVAIADAISVVPGYIAQSQTVTTEIDTTLEVVLAATTFGSPGPRYFRVVTPPASGSLNVAVGTALSGTILEYTPNQGFSGVDTFEYEAYDVYSAYPRTAVVAAVAIGVGEAGADALSSGGQAASSGMVLAAGVVANTAPVITDPGAQSFTVGDSVDVNVPAADVEGDSLTWSVDVLPAGVEIVAHTGRIVGNPTVAGSLLSTVTVSDGELFSRVAIAWVILSPPEVSIVAEASPDRACNGFEAICADGGG